MMNLTQFLARRVALILPAAILMMADTMSAQLTRLSFGDLGLHGHFGRELDVHDDHVVVSEPNYSSTTLTHAGRAHVYRRNENTWVHEGTLDNAPTKSYNHFGHDISVHDQDLAVSAPDLGTGTVYMYSRAETVWEQVQQITMPAELYRENPHVKFGENVELTDGWLVISAPGYLGTSDPVIRTGAVFIYKKEGSGWTFHQMILPPDLSRSTQFANDVEINSSYMLITATKGDGGALSSGVVYLYRFEGNSWIPDYTFINPSSRSHELFGADVDIHDNTIVIGVPMHTRDESMGPHGAAHVFQRFGNTWIRTALIEASDGKRNDMFGSTVVVEDGNIVIGAPRHDQPNKADVGKVYHYVVENGFWTEKSTYIPLEEDIQSHIQFGGNLSLHQKQLVISGHLMNNSLEDSGVAYVTDIDLSTANEDPEISSSRLRIRPNPVAEEMRMILDGEWGASIFTTIYALDGRAMLRQEISNPAANASHYLNVSELAPGTYFLHVNDGNRTSIHKWIKI